MPLSEGQMQSIFEEPCRSKLRFISRPGAIEGIHVDQLRRMREPVSRSKPCVQSKVADVLSGRSRHAESQNELKAFRILLSTGHADAWQEQPFLLEYHHEGAKQRYTPDILIDWGEHREVVEVKEDSDAELPENQSRFALIGDLLAEHGYRFRLWKKSEICAEPRLSNAALILRYRWVAVAAAERERLRQAFFATPELELQTLCEMSNAAVQTVFRLVLEGILHFDWWKPIGLNSRVSIVPIGHQIWPYRPPNLKTLSEEAKCQ